MSVPTCLKCGGGYVCAQCDFPLRKAHLRSASIDHVVAGSGESYSPESRAYLDALRGMTPYAFGFKSGPRGGAVVDFGRAIEIECFLPYEEPRSGASYPFMPMPLNGDVIHDIGKMKVVPPWELEACMRRECRCDDRPTGWRLTRPILRAILGVTDSYLNEHGRQLPGVLSCWCLCEHAGIHEGSVFQSRVRVSDAKRQPRGARDARGREEQRVQTASPCIPPRAQEEVVAMKG